MNLYLDEEEEAYVKNQEKGFLRNLVRIAMNGGELIEEVPEPENRTGMRWLQCTPAVRAKLNDFYTAHMLPTKKG